MCWAGREGGVAQGGGDSGGLVFLALVTQLQRSSTNKRILCPKWLPCKLSSTLRLICVCLCLKREGKTDIIIIIIEAQQY